jgi:hypothetical protein
VVTDLMLAHTVFIRLHDSSSEARQRLVDSCRKHLAGHPGTVFFAVGTLADDIAWSVSDRDFDVALHLVFANKAAHDQYLDSDRHTRFMEENEPHWAVLRVFDSYVTG